MIEQKSTGQAAHRRQIYQVRKKGNRLSGLKLLQSLEVLHRMKFYCQSPTRILSSTFRFILKILLQPHQYAEILKDN